MGGEHLLGVDARWGHEPVFLFIEQLKAIRRTTKRRRRMGSRFMARQPFPSSRGGDALFRLVARADLLAKLQKARVFLVASGTPII